MTQSSSEGTMENKATSNCSCVVWLLLSVNPKRVVRLLLFVVILGVISMAWYVLPSSSSAPQQQQASITTKGAILHSTQQHQIGR